MIEVNGIVGITFKKKSPIIFILSFLMKLSNKVIIIKNPNTTNKICTITQIFSNQPMYIFSLPFKRTRYPQNLKHPLPIDFTKK